MTDWELPYGALIEEARRSSEPVQEFLRRELPHLWIDAYCKATPRPVNILLVTHGTFDYIYDHYAELESTGVVAYDNDSESRLIGAVGISTKNLQPRGHDDSRKSGWIGPNVRLTHPGDAPDKEWDKGHFIGHALGGAVDGVEINLFRQLRALNRGGYRQMEAYCSAHPGTLCFSRPTYCDRSARPSRLEFGILMPDGELNVKVFENR